ncbi:MerR family transcriptional regulator [Massilia sp.]|uniref:MerR family transcriptional regulator n=1 Tax=Massilia sp. TaxID=1882437 RepID=UPI00391CB94B
MSIRGDPPDIDELIPITEVERLTGIRQATLRMWEKRYGFPQPLRDRHGDRVYPPVQVERLHAARRLMDQGLRPGKIFTSVLASGVSGVDAVFPLPASVPGQYRHVFALLRDYRIAELHGLFQHRLLDLGLRRFVIEYLAPLVTEVGLAWNRGELPVRCEHLFAQASTSALHAKQAAVRAAGDGRPKAILATLSGEPHALGILMAEAVMTSLGMNCIPLGADVPSVEVAAAARETGADIVALSFSAYFPRRSMLRLTASLRTSLPPATMLWIGGEGVRGTAPEAGIERFLALEGIEIALQAWRKAHPNADSVRWYRP